MFLDSERIFWGGAVTVSVIFTLTLLLQEVLPKADPNAAPKISHYSTNQDIYNLRQARKNDLITVRNALREHFIMHHEMTQVQALTQANILMGFDPQLGYEREP